MAFGFDFLRLHVRGGVKLSHRLELCIRYSFAARIVGIDLGCLGPRGQFYQCTGNTEVCSRKSYAALERQLDPFELAPGIRQSNQAPEAAVELLDVKRITGGRDVLNDRLTRWHHELRASHLGIGKLGM